MSGQPYNMLKAGATLGRLPVTVSSVAGDVWAGEALSRLPVLAGLGWFANEMMLLRTSGYSAWTKDVRLYPQDGWSPAYEILVYRESGDNPDTEVVETGGYDKETDPIPIGSLNPPFPAGTPYWSKAKVWTKVRCERLLFAQNCVLRLDNGVWRVDFSDAVLTWMAPRVNKVARPGPAAELARPYSGWGDLYGFWADAVVDWRFGVYKDDRDGTMNNSSDKSYYRQYWADRMHGNPPGAWFEGVDMLELTLPNADTVIPSKRTRTERVSKGCWGSLSMPSDMEVEIEASRVMKDYIEVGGVRYQTGQRFYPLSDGVSDGEILFCVKEGKLWQYVGARNVLVRYTGSMRGVQANHVVAAGGLDADDGVTEDYGWFVGNDGIRYTATDPWGGVEIHTLRDVLEDKNVVLDTNSGLYWVYDAKTDLMRPYAGTGGESADTNPFQFGAGGVVLVFEYQYKWNEDDDEIGGRWSPGEFDNTETRWKAVVPRWTDGQRVVWDGSLEIEDVVELGHPYTVYVVPAEELALLYRAVYDSPYTKAKKAYKKGWEDYHKVNKDYDEAMAEWRRTGRQGPRPQRARSNAEMSAWRDALEEAYPRPHDVDPDDNPYEDECGDFWEGSDVAKEWVVSNPPDRLLYWGVCKVENGNELPDMPSDEDSSSGSASDSGEEGDGDDLPQVDPLREVVGVFEEGGPFWTGNDSGTPVSRSMLTVLGIGPDFSMDGDAKNVSELNGKAFDLLLHCQSHEKRMHQKQKCDWDSVHQRYGEPKKYWRRDRENDWNMSVKAWCRWMKNLPPAALPEPVSQGGGD